MWKNLSFKLVIGSIAFVFILFCFFVFAFQLPKWFSFGTKKALDEWDEKVFKGKVLYSVQEEAKNSYLNAYSKGSASGIFYKLAFNPRRDPMVSWKWKVIKFPEKISAAPEKSGWIEKDDYAARFYLIFPAIIFTNIKCLEYVWDKNLPEGTMMTSPYFGNIKIIVAESGDKNLGQWVFEERNVNDDYQKAFGRAAAKVGAIAIMTDTDNTASIAEADYDEVRVGYQQNKY